MPILPLYADRLLIERIFRAIGPAPIRIVLGDGEGVSPPGVTPVATVILHDRRILAGLAVDPEVTFGEAYAAGRLEIQGDLVGFLEAVYNAWHVGKAATGWYQKATSKWMEWWQANHRNGSRKNVHHHYDLGNDFYKLWLDRDLVYTCAYFPTPSATLEEAQHAKLDYVCRKLRLQAGETVVEAGCGWGALALHMARNYGVNVRAFNVSHEQIVFARQRAREEGLESQVEFIEDDYRNISGNCDAFVSVGMLEHVGRNHLAELGAVVHRVLGDSGRGLLHFIGRSHPAPVSRWIRKRIFPGGYCPTLREAITTLEPWNFSVLDVENLRLHYAKTLEHWLDRFEKSHQEVRAAYGEWFVRAWRAYLAGSIAAFRCNSLQLFQVVFAGSKCPPAYWTRAPLYTGELLDPGSEQERGEPWTHAMS